MRFTPQILGFRMYNFFTSHPVTIAGYFKNSTDTQAEAAGALSSLANNIFLRSSFVVRHSGGFDAALLMHEVMHNLGPDDDALEQALGIPVGTPSDAITQRLATDCFGVTNGRAVAAGGNVQ